MAIKQEEILDAIGNMTVIELSELVDAFKEKFNVTAVAAPMAMPGGAAPGAAEAVVGSASPLLSKPLPVPVIAYPGR